MSRTLFNNCRIYRPASADELLERAWILVEDGKVKQLGSGVAPIAETIVDLEGQRVLPGLINAHTHLYSALAGRMPWPQKRPASFRKILEQIWWKLDRALDEESLRMSARLGIYEALRRGTTTLIDHHSSPSCADGSLAVIAQEAEQFGIKLALAYEVSERNGEDAMEDGIDENVRALENYARHDTLRGVYGFHAGFTLSDESIEHALEILPLETPCHIHCAESKDDMEHARSLGYESAVDRLAALGILRPGSLLIHCIHLAQGDAELIREMGAFVVHCPQSNAHNQVGTADVGAMLGTGVKVGLGTDGFLSGMLTEAQFARDTGVANGTLMPGKLGTLLFENNPAIASSIFGRPIGWLEEGEDADFIVQEADGTVLDPKAKIQRVVSRGVTVCEAGEVLGVDAEALYADAERQAARVWKRIQTL